MKVSVAVSALVAVAAAKQPFAPCNDACKTSHAMRGPTLQTGGPSSSSTTKTGTGTGTSSTLLSSAPDQDQDQELLTVLDLGPGTAFPPDLPLPLCTETGALPGARHPVMTTPTPTATPYDNDRSTYGLQLAPPSSSPDETPTYDTQTDVYWHDCGTCAFYWTTSLSEYVPAVTVTNTTDYTYTITQVSCRPSSPQYTASKRRKPSDEDF
ncbi:uncharacterized protein MAM_03245 [Metarhizium album ARSEF 1941]|uniref:Uncharacterized protein n=1 Tax=Metarhizium album (strain ARSEF 1941) TaxID=1081103 RepID=A0A0B2WXN9_METAS|nr:uncharacterized protein MAM_03245 [Metarhizium album ARSEF 1941]KHN98783.1 hypothetical protein MAM_03245 [Metarhizium album ARSEF 1941]